MTLLAAVLFQAVLWVDVTDDVLPETREWTNRVEIADLDEDGRPDLLFANGGNYSEPGEPEANRVFLNRPRDGALRFEEATVDVLGPTPDIARVIKVRDLDGDGHPDIVVGTTYETQSRLYLGEGSGRFREVTSTHLPALLASVGDLEIGDVDGDSDLDIVLANWGPGNNMRNVGGRTLLWLNDGSGRFTDATAERMPETLVRFSWDLELVDVDNDFDLDVLVSCKRCGGGSLFRNDGSGHFEEDFRGLPQYTNNYDYEPMDVDADGFLDLVTVNDGAILGGQSFNRREHLFVNDGEGRYRDLTPERWPDAANVGEDDNNIAFLDFDSDGDSDFIVASLTGEDRLLVNDGRGRFGLRLGVFGGEPTPGTLSLVLADLDGDHRTDAVQGQGEHETAVAEKVYLGRGLEPDTAPPVISMVAVEGGLVRARIHDGKSPTAPHDWGAVALETPTGAVPMTWYGEYLWRAPVPTTGGFRVCASDSAGNRSCRPGR